MTNGHTVIGNSITIHAVKDCERFGSFCNSYWSEVTIRMNGHEIDIDDLTDANKEFIIEQLPML